MPLSQGRVLKDRYRIAKCLGKSAFGAVYRAWDLNVHGSCAIEEIIDSGGNAQEIFALRASQISNIQHPGIPKILDAFSLIGQGHYLVSEFVDGQNLQDIFDQEDRPLNETVIIPWLYQACDILTVLHDEQPPIFHGNLIPARIRISQQGNVVLVGLGPSLVYNQETGNYPGGRPINPGYSPPECYGKGIIEAHSDVFSLGAIFYFLLSGKMLPESVLVLGNDVKAPLPLRERNPQVSSKVAQAVDRAIQVQPANRYSSIVEFKSAMYDDPKKVVTDAQKRSNLWAIFAVGIILAVLLLGIIIAGGFFLYRMFSASSTLASTTVPVKLTPTVVPSPTPLIPTATPTSEITPLPTSLSTQIVDASGIPMVLIPSGSFQMGSMLGSLEEQPVHLVELENYYLDLYEVTNQQYTQCVQSGPCDPPTDISSAKRSEYYGNPEFSEYPVIYVSWSMTQEYCEWRGARLPNEAEWEYAAKGDKDLVFPWGDQIDCLNANYWGNTSDCHLDTNKVGSYLQGISPLGLYDMAGNVWEWVNDWFDPNYYADSPLVNPTGPETGGFRVIRGGAWNSAATHLRTTTRGRNLPDGSYNYVGFRCALTP